MLGDVSPNGMERNLNHPNHLKYTSLSYHQQSTTVNTQKVSNETVRYDVCGKGLMVGMGPCRTTACLMWNLLMTRSCNKQICNKQSTTANTDSEQSSCLWGMLENCFTGDDTPSECFYRRLDYTII